MLFTRSLFLLAVVTPLSLPQIQAQTNEIRNLAGTLAQEIAASGKKSVAVVDFTDLQGNPTELGRFLSEEFAVALTRTRKGFEIVDRNHLNTLMKEYKLASTGLIDPATAKKLGQLAGVDALITGSLTPFGDSVRMAVKVIATDTARMITADSTDLPKTRTIEELLGKASGGGAPPQAGGGWRPAGSGTEGARSPIPSSQPASPPAPRMLSATGKEFVFELAQCRATGATARCTFRVTNRGPDGEMAIQEAFMFDDAGNETRGSSGTLANKRPGDSLLLVSGVPVAATLVFDGVSPTASSIVLLRLRSWYRRPTDGDTFLIEIRNAPLTR